MHVLKQFASASLAIWTVAFAPLAQAQETTVVQMGAGNIAGVYFPVGVAICRLVNQNRPEHGLRCAARLSDGSVDNVGRLRDGSVDLAIVQSDVQNAARMGDDPFTQTGAFSDLRAVMSLYPEPLTIVAHPDAGISKLDDIQGKRLSIGPAGSGQRVLLEALSDALGWDENALANDQAMRSGQVAQALCAGEIDAFAMVIGHPAPPVEEATEACGAVLIAVEGSGVDDMISGDSPYALGSIPAGLYAGQTDSVPSVSVSATLVTRSDTPDETISILVETVFSDIDVLRDLDPALVGLDAEVMVSTGLTAPLHDAAREFYRAQGWVD